MLFRQLILLIQFKKADYDTKIGKIEKKIPSHNKYITTPEVNKLTAENVAARLAQAKLATKSDNANFVKKTDFDNKLKKYYNINEKITLNKSKHLLVENKLNELQEKVKLLSTKSHNFLLGRTYFTSDNSQQTFFGFDPMFISLKKSY